MATTVETSAAAARPVFTTPTTAEELLRLPDGAHGEIVDGRFLPMTAPGGYHGLVALRVGRLVGNHVDATGVGATFAAETAFRLRRDPELTRCPDCAFVTADRLSALLGWGVVEGAPDLAVEVLPPSNTPAEIGRKTAEYLDHGCRLVWIVDPEAHTVTAYPAGGAAKRLGAGAVLDGGAVLPSFSTPVAALFTGIPGPGGPSRPR